MTLLLILVGSAVLTAACILLLLRTSTGELFLDTTDKPNAMHAAPVPRIGGLPIAAVSGAAYLVFNADASFGLVGRAVLAALAVALFSLVDDKRGLPAWVRLIVHFLAAAFLMLTVSSVANPQATIFHSVPGLIFLTVAAVWATNLYNFMDGANGLAGWMGLIGFGALSIASLSSPTQLGHELAIFCTAISGACGGFLLFNFPRGAIFLGDVGAIFLGFSAAAVGIIGAAAGLWPLWLPVLFFSPFIVDTTITLLRRLFRAERVWQPHRQHIYHRLIISCGWSHTRTALAYALLMALAGGHGLWWLAQQKAETAHNLVVPPLPILLTWVITYCSLLAVTEWHIQRQLLRKTTMSAKEDQGAR